MPLTVSSYEHSHCQTYFVASPCFVSDTGQHHFNTAGLKTGRCGIIPSQPRHVISTFANQRLDDKKCSVNSNNPNSGFVAEISSNS